MKIEFEISKAQIFKGLFLPPQHNGYRRKNQYERIPLVIFCSLLPPPTYGFSRLGKTKSDIRRKTLNLNQPYFASLIGQAGTVFANGPRDLGLIPGRIIPKT